MKRLFYAAALLLDFCSAHAATIIATPANLPAMLATAAGGDTLRLSPGAYPRINLAGRKYSPRLRIDATGATIAGVTLTGANGITWNGGSVSAMFGIAAVGADGYGFAALGAKNVSITGAEISEANKGIAIGLDAENIVVADNKLTGNLGDGIVIGGGKNIVIAGNRIGPPIVFDPTYHRDGIQFWAGVQGITIYGNTIKGDTQGITDLGPTKDVGVVFNTGVVITGNDLFTTQPHGITTINSPGASVRGNRLMRVNPRGKWDPTIRTAAGDASTNACGNVNEWRPTSLGTARCK